MLLKIHNARCDADAHGRATGKAFWNAPGCRVARFSGTWSSGQYGDLRCERFGITHFPHPQLLETIETLAPETRLLALIDARVIHQPDQFDMDGNGGGIGTTISQRTIHPRSRRLLDWNKRNWQLLGASGEETPGRVQPERKGHKRLWDNHSAEMTP